MIPTRMNTVPVFIRSYDSASTQVDTHFGSPASLKSFTYLDPVEYAAQVVYGDESERVDSITGDPSRSDGRLTFSRTYLDGVGYVPKKGDLIVQIAGWGVNFEVSEVIPAGHLRGQYNLVCAFFIENTDTNPIVRR